MITIHYSDLIAISNLKASNIQYEASDIEYEGHEHLLIKYGTDVIEGYYEQYALESGSMQAYIYIYYSKDGAAIGYQHDIFKSGGDEETAADLVSIIAEDFVKKTIVLYTTLP